MNGFFPEQPCYCIEILEWINVEDITDEWRYIWKHDPPEPVYAVMMGGFVESLNLAFVYESIYTKSEYEQIRQNGFDYQTLSWMTHILTDCPDDSDYEMDKRLETEAASRQPPKFPFFSTIVETNLPAIKTYRIQRKKIAAELGSCFSNEEKV